MGGHFREPWSPCHRVVYRKGTKSSIARIANFLLVVSDFFFFLNRVLTSLDVSFMGEDRACLLLFEVALFVLFSLDTCLGVISLYVFAENEMAAKRLCDLII